MPRHFSSQLLPHGFSHLGQLPAFILAILFIAVCTFSTGAYAQKVYRCGNTYSQSPCPGGNAVDTSGSQVRAEAKKSQADADRSAKAADKMEKLRLAQEKRDRANNGATVIDAQPLPRDARDAKDPKSAGGKSDPPAAGKQKRSGSELFTAKAPTEPKPESKSKAKPKATSAKDKD
jgi:hypothetical protein